METMEEGVENALKFIVRIQKLVIHVLKMVHASFRRIATLTLISDTSQKPKQQHVTPFTNIVYLMMVNMKKLTRSNLNISRGIFIEKINFLYNSESTEIRMDLDDFTIQIYDAHRPHYYEYAVHQTLNLKLCWNLIKSLFE